MCAARQSAQERPHWVNETQEQVLRSYCEGEFAGLLDEVTAARFGGAVAACGDGLLRFLLTELADSEGVDSVEEGLRRVNAAVDQLRAVADVLANQVYNTAAG